MSGTGVGTSSLGICGNGRIVQSPLKVKAIGARRVVAHSCSAKKRAEYLSAFSRSSAFLIDSEEEHRLDIEALRPAELCHGVFDVADRLDLSECAGAALVV